MRIHRAQHGVRQGGASAGVEKFSEDVIAELGRPAAESAERPKNRRAGKSDPGAEVGKPTLGGNVANFSVHFADGAEELDLYAILEPLFLDVFGHELIASLHRVD